MAGIEFKPLDKGTYDYYKKYTQRNENAEYWINRTFKAEAMAEKTSDQLLRDMIEVYKKSYKELEREIEAFYGRYATENGLSLAEVHKRLDPRQLKSALEEIKRYYDFAKPEKIGKNMSREYRDELRRLSARAYMSRLEEIKMKMKQIVVKLAAEEKTHFDKSLKQIYSQAHSQASYNIDKGLGFSEGYSAPSEEALEKIVSQKWLDSNYSDRIWQDKGKLLTAIEQELLSGIAQGHNPRKIAGAMSDLYGMNYKNCERLARTETIHYFNEATSDSYKEHGIEEYQFVCSLDERTCPECGALDGEVFDLKYKVEGVNYPVIHPNCYDSETVVLTKDGWKLFKDCTDNDEYLSANPKNPKQMKFIKAKKRISYLYKGSMIQFSGDGFTCRVTENHNMFVLSDIKLMFYRLYTRPFFISAKELYEKFKKKNFFVYANDIEYIRSVKYQPNREEIVYCVELPEWHTLLVRRNGGFPVWCGNCRCTTIPYFEPDEIDKMFDEATRVAYDEKHNLYDVPANMTYKQWLETVGSERQRTILGDKRYEMYKQGKQLSDFVKDGRKLTLKELNNKQESNETGRFMATGQRRSIYADLTKEEIDFVKKEAKALQIPESMLLFKQNFQTQYDDIIDKVVIGSDVMPSNDGSAHNRDTMSVRAVLAHEYYGHKTFTDRKTKLKPGDLRDEIRASYYAAVNAPNLSDLERAQLMRDALDRASEAGITIRMTDEIRRILYGR